MSRVNDTEADAFMRRFWVIVAICVSVLTIPLLVGAFILDRRLDRFEDSLRFQPSVDIDVDEGNDDYTILHPVQGQLVYVPAYSHVYHQDGQPHLLTITLSVRNTSPDHAIQVKSIRYYDTAGKEAKSYLEKPRKLGPLATTEFLVERGDTSGGSGANFLVEWHSDQIVSEPIIEAVMIDTQGQQGISFARMGTVIRELHSAEPDTGEPDQPSNE